MPHDVSHVQVRAIGLPTHLPSSIFPQSPAVQQCRWGVEGWTRDLSIPPSSVVCIVRRRVCGEVCQALLHPPHPWASNTHLLHIHTHRRTCAGAPVCMTTCRPLGTVADQGKAACMYSIADGRRCIRQVYCLKWTWSGACAGVGRAQGGRVGTCAATPHSQPQQ